MALRAGLFSRHLKRDGNGMSIDISLSKAVSIDRRWQRSTVRSSTNGDLKVSKRLAQEDLVRILATASHIRICKRIANWAGARTNSLAL